METLLELYWAFLKIGISAVGAGTAAITMMYHELVRGGWLSASELSDMIAIGSMLPGPFAVTTAALAGHRIAGTLGPLGAVVAVAGLLTPSVILLGTIMYVVSRFTGSKLIGIIHRAMRPGALGLVIAASYALARNGLVDLPTAAIAVASLGLFIWKKEKVHPGLAILAFGLLGVVLFGRG